MNGPILGKKLFQKAILDPLIIAVGTAKALFPRPMLALGPHRIEVLRNGEILVGLRAFIGGNRERILHNQKVGDGSAKISLADSIPRFISRESEG